MGKKRIAAPLCLCVSVVNFAIVQETAIAERLAPPQITKNTTARKCAALPVRTNMCQIAWLNGRLSHT